MAVQESLFDRDERRRWATGPGSTSAQDGSTRRRRIVRANCWTTIPWRAERRQMYDRVLDVPRLVSFHDLFEEHPPHPALNSYAGGSTTSTPANSASRSPPPACACIATAPTVWPGTATPSAAAAPRTPWWRSSASAPPGPSRCAPAAAARRCGFQHGHGDLLVMGGSCQRTWEHSVPKTSARLGRGSASSSAHATCARPL